MKKNILIGVIVLLVCTAGCKKPAEGIKDYTSPLIVNTIENLTAVSGNTYANLRSQNLYGWSLLVGPFAVGEHAGDEAGPMDLIDNIGTMAYNHPLPGDEYIVNTWNGYFTGIGSANATLSAADSFALKYAVASDSQSIRYIRGESLFMRAWYYFQVESFYGQKFIDMKESPLMDSTVLGVPLFTTPPTSLLTSIKPRATAREIWIQIINDLRAATTLLPSSWSGTEQQRATSWAAKALLGKAFVFTQQWDSAKKYLGDVITNSGKSLMPFDVYKTAFNDAAPRNSGLTNYGAQPRFNQESLFELYVQRVPGNGGYGIFGTPPNGYLGTSMGLYWAPSGFDNNGVSVSMSGRANIYFHDKNLLRFGFTIPVDSISGNALVPNQNYPDPNVAAGKKAPSNWYIAQSQAFRTNKTDDPRLYVCALEPYMDTVYFSADNSSGDRKKRLVAKYNAIPRAGDGGGGFDPYYAWSFKKYQTLDANLLESDIAETDGADYYLLRLADVYLLEAEALMNAPGGAPYTAIDYINAVHRRAYGYSPALGSSSPVDYGGLTDATKADPATDPNLANNPLAYERFVELFAEGHWWFDIGRWGNSTNSVSGSQAPGNAAGLYRNNFGNNEATYYGKLLPNNTFSRWNPASTSPDIPATYCYPIPITELNANALMRAQARGGQNYPF